jgi:hypothetical protein
MMEYILGIIVFLSLLAIIIWSILQSSKEENAKRDKDFVDRIRKSALERKPSICIEVDGCKIMLKEDFIKREWYKTKEGGIPIRGQYEPAVHFLKRVDEYRKMKAEQKRYYDEELARKKQSSLGRCAKAPLSKSEYEADEILKNYNGEK